MQLASDCFSRKKHSAEIYSYTFLEKFRENNAFTYHSVVEMYYKVRSRTKKFRKINSSVTLSKNVDYFHGTFAENA